MSLACCRVVVWKEVLWAWGTGWGGGRVNWSVGHNIPPIQFTPPEDVLYGWTGLVSMGSWMEYQMVDGLKMALIEKFSVMHASVYPPSSLCISEHATAHLHAHASINVC